MGHDNEGDLPDRPDVVEDTAELVPGLDVEPLPGLVPERNSGSEASARASATRCASPPLSLDG